VTRVDASSVRDARSALRAGLGVVVAVVAIILAAPATAGPSSSAPGALSVTSSALPAEVLPGETTLVVVEVSNVGGSTLTGVTLVESAPAAIAFVPGSTVAVRESASGATAVYSDAVPIDSASARALGAYNPGQLVSEFDRIDLAPGDTLRVSFLVIVNPALAPRISALSVTSIATSGRVTVGSDSVTLTILEDALAWAYSE
jgi:uncharacterized repeat protein (TIGR01451 family)